MSVFLFPGQGSQFKGMGSGLFNKYPDYMEIANEILGYSIEDVCMNNPSNKLNNTLFTQPALFVVNALYFLDTKDRKSPPAFYAGHSLGELNALMAAEVFDFKTGLRIVQKRASLMSQATGGGMAAILDTHPDKIRDIIKESKLDIEVANYNAPGQTVVSGRKEEINKGQSIFDNYKIKYIPLNVSGAFHSSLMKNAKNEFSTFVSEFDFKHCKTPVISNFTGKLYENGKEKNSLIEQITNPVRWTDIIQYLIEQGQYIFYEIGPGEVLTKLNNKILNAEMLLK